jgi:hypothetical protein
MAHHHALFLIFVINSSMHFFCLAHADDLRAPGVEQLQPASGMRGDAMPDVAEYLREIPLDWLSDAANLLSQTLRFDIENGITGSSWPVRVPPGEYCSFYQYCSLH